MTGSPVLNDPIFSKSVSPVQQQLQYRSNVPVRQRAARHPAAQHEATYQPPFIRGAPSVRDINFLGPAVFLMPLVLRITSPDASIQNTVALGVTDARL